MRTRQRQARPPFSEEKIRKAAAMLLKCLDAGGKTPDRLRLLPPQLAFVQWQVRSTPAHTSDLCPSTCLSYGNKE